MVSDCNFTPTFIFFSGASMVDGGISFLPHSYDSASCSHPLPALTKRLFSCFQVTSAVCRYKWTQNCRLWSSKLFSRRSVIVEQSVVGIEEVVTDNGTVLQPAKDGNVHTLLASIFIIRLLDTELNRTQLTAFLRRVITSRDTLFNSY